MTETSNGGRHKDPSYLHFLPFLLLLAVVCIATLLPAEPWEPGADNTVRGPANTIDWIFRHFGPLLPFLVFALQWWCLPYDKLCKDAEVCFFAWKLSLAQCALLIWVLMMAARLLLYLPISKVHYWFSDHIFLVTCLLAQLQMKLFLAHSAPRHRRGGNGARVVMVAGWSLTVVLLIESFMTARYYHTSQATWTALVCGTLLFGGVAKLWTSLIERRLHDPNGSEPLLDKPQERESQP